MKSLDWLATIRGGVRAGQLRDSVMAVSILVFTEQVLPINTTGFRSTKTRYTSPEGLPVKDPRPALEVVITSPHDKYSKLQESSVGCGVGRAVGRKVGIKVSLGVG